MARRPLPFVEPLTPADYAAVPQSTTLSEDVLNALAPEDRDDPTLMETLSAFWRRENTVGSILSSDAIAEQMFPTPDPTPLTFDEMIAKAKQDGVVDFTPYRNVRTVEHYNAVTADLKQERQDAEITAAAGWSGILLGLPAALTDPTSYIPGVGPAARAGGIVRTGLAIGGQAAVSSAVQESILQGTQNTRTLEESAINLGASFVLAGALGSAFTALRPEFRGRLIERTDEVLADHYNGNPKIASLSAAYNDAFRTRGQIADAVDPRLSSLGMDKVMKNLAAPFKFSKTTGEFMEEYLHNPILDAMDSPVPEVRAFSKSMFDNPHVTQSEAEGRAAVSETVQAVHGRTMGSLYTALFEVKSQYDAYKKSVRAGGQKPISRTEFNRRVGYATRNNSVDELGDPFVEAAAKRARAFLDEGHKQLADLEMVPEEWKSITAATQVSRTYDRDQLRIDKAKFLDVISEYYEGDLRQLAIDQVEARAARDAAITASQDRAEAELIERLRTEGAGKAPKASEIAEARRQAKQQVTADFSLKQIRDEAREAERDRLLAAQKEVADAAEEALRAASKRTNGPGKAAIAKARAEAIRARPDLEVTPAALKEAVQAAEEAIEKEIEDAVEAAVRQLEADAAKRGRKATKAEIKKARAEARATTRAEIERVNSPIDPIDIAVVARANAEKLYKTLMGDTGGKTLDYQRTTGMRGYSKSRKILLPDKLLADNNWIVSDIDELMNQFARTAGADAAIGTVFKVKKKRKVLGPDGNPVLDDKGKAVVEEYDAADLQLSSITKPIADHYNKLVEDLEVDPKFATRDSMSPEEITRRKVARGREEDRLLRARDREIARIEQVRDLFRGSLSYGARSTGSSVSWQKMMEIASIWNMTRLLGGTVISSLTDPVNVVLANGFSRTIRYGVLPMLTDFRTNWLNASSVTRAHARHAAVVFETVTNARLMEFAGQDAFHTGDSAVRFFRKIAQVFGKASGTVYWTDLMRQISYNVTQARVAELATTGWARLPKEERAWLATNGVGEAELAKIADAFQGQRNKSYGGVPFVEWKEWTDKDAAKLVRNLLNKEGKMQVIQPGIGDKAVALSANPTAKVIFAFKSFMLANSTRTMARNLQLAQTGRGKAASLAGGLLGLVAMGVLIDGLKTAMTENEVDFNAWADRMANEPGRATYDALDRSGMFGPITDYINTGSRAGAATGLNRIASGAAGRIGGEDAEDWVADFLSGGAKESSRARRFDQGPVEVLMGPGGALLDGIWTTGVDTLPGIVKGDLKRRELQKTRQLIPGQNIPILKQALDLGMQQLGEVYDWPDPR